MFCLFEIVTCSKGKLSELHNKKFILSAIHNIHEITRTIISGNLEMTFEYSESVALQNKTPASGTIFVASPVSLTPYACIYVQKKLVRFIFTMLKPSDASFMIFLFGMVP